MEMCVTDSPLGPLVIEAGDRGISGCRPDGRARLAAPSTPLLRRAAEQIGEYFRHERQEFDLPLDLSRGATPFRLRVWEALLGIPFGCVVSYAELARRVGNPRASRAVAQACHHNPVALIVPCHRVIGSDGSLTGYASGVELKRMLLCHEGRLPVGHDVPGSAPLAFLC